MADNTPNPQQVPANTQSAANPQPAPELNPDLAGYPSPEALAQAYRASGAEAQKWRQRAEENQRVLEQIQAQSRPTIPDRSTPSSTLQEYGVPVDALGAYVTEHIKQAFEPISRGIQARGEVVAAYPDYQKFEADVAQYIQTDPSLNDRYQRMFSVDPAAAMEFAFLKFGESRRSTVRSSSGNGDERSQAAIPQSRSGGARGGDALQSAISEAWKAYNETGSAQAKDAFIRMRLRQAIPDEHYQGG